MKVHVIKWMPIEVFAKRHACSKFYIEKFKESIKNADWEVINDVKKTFGSADVIDNNRIIFNIGGNNYRLICAFWFDPKMVHLYVKWIGAHAQYTK